MVISRESKTGLRDTSPEDGDAEQVIVYYVDNSIHQIPSFIYIAIETGGKILTDGVDSYHTIQTEYPRVDVEYYTNMEQVIDRTLELEPHVVVHCDYHYHQFAEKIRAVYVQVFHGTSDKKYNYSNQLKPYDFMLLAGEKMREDMKSSGRLTPSNHRVVGYSKLDPVFRGELDKDEAMKSLNLPGDRPVVLYAPTWRDGHGHSSIGPFSKALLENVPDDIELVIKLHPNTVRDTKYYELFKKHSKKANVKLIAYASNIIPIMAASDLLITDISTVSHEFLAFQRPMVFLASPWRFMGFRNNTWIWQCGDVVYKRRDIWNTIIRNLNEPNRHKETIEKCLNYVFYKPDGNAAKRAGDAILELARR